MCSVAVSPRPCISVYSADNDLGIITLLSTAAWGVAPRRTRSRTQLAHPRVSDGTLLQNSSNDPEGYECPADGHEASGGVQSALSAPDKHTRFGVAALAAGVNRAQPMWSRRKAIPWRSICKLQAYRQAAGPSATVPPRWSTSSVRFITSFATSWRRGFARHCRASQQLKRPRARHYVWSCVIELYFLEETLGDQHPLREPGAPGCVARQQSVAGRVRTGADIAS